MNSSQWVTPPPGRTGNSRWFCWFIGLFVFATSLRLGIGTADTDLDLSWSAVIAWSHLHGAQWGRDIVFTYGPLGWLNPFATYNPELFWIFFASQIALSLGVATVFTFAFGLARTPQRLILLLMLLVLTPWLYSDLLLLGTLILAIAALEYIAASLGHGAAAAGCGVIAILASALGLLKFSFFPLTVGLWLCGSTLLLLRARAGLACFWFAALPLLSLALWLANGQALDQLTAYFHTSMHMAAGYGHAMGRSGALLPLLACLAAGLFIGLLLAIWLRAERTARLRALAVCGYLALALFIVWRASFTRADSAHVSFFLPLCSLILAVLVCFSRDLPSPVLRRVIQAAMIAAVAGSLLLVAPTASLEAYRNSLAYNRDIWQSLLAPTSLRDRYDAGRAQVRKQFDLPRIRAIIGSERIDLLTTSQGIALVNDFNFAPRPVFQSYAAYTTTLLRLNESYFLGAQAPPFVLMKMDVLDERYPTSEDALALIALLRNYRPVEAERGFLLLRRGEGSSAPSPAAADTYADLAPSLWIDVPAHENALLMHADIELNTLGRLYSFLLREPAWRIEVQLSDGQLRQYRLLRETARSGFLLSPLFVGEHEYLNWFYGETGMHVRRVRLLAPIEWQQSLLAPIFRIGFTPIELPREQPQARPKALISSLYPGFDISPTSRVGQTTLIVEDDKPALFMHATGFMDFSPAAGSYRLDLEYGVRRAAYESSDCVNADGIRLQIDLLHQQQVSTQFQRDINPFITPADRGAQHARIYELQVGRGDTLRVSLTPGPQDNAACDWGYLRNLTLQPLPL